MRLPVWAVHDPRHLRKRTVGPYSLIRELGRGGMGAVFLAHDERLDREVAIKLIDVRGPEATQRFMAEARVTARCKHANIVDIYDIAEDDGQPYMVLELIEGESVHAMVQRGPVAPARAIAIMTHVARGLAFAHSRGILHRDLKPPNILVGNDEIAKIVDFGIAKPVDEDELYGGVGPFDMARDMTATSQMPGTLHYIAPEHARHDPCDDRVDLWAFGVTLYQMLSGRRPLDGLPPREVLAHLADLEREVPRLDELAPGLPPGLVHLVHRCLEKRVELRIGSAAELVAALEALGPSRKPSVRSPALPKAQPARSRRWVVGAVIAAALAAASLWWLAGRRGGATTASSTDPAAAARVAALVAELERLDAQGDPAEGDRLLGLFLGEEPDPHAQALAWLVRGDREHARRGPGIDEALSSYATAYARAADRQVQRRALLAVARIYLEGWEWDRLSAALDGFSGADAEVDELRDRLRLAERDQVATSSADPTTARVARAVLHGRPIDVTPVSMVIADVEGDGVSELIAIEGDAIVVRRAASLDVVSRRPISGIVDLRCAGRDPGGAYAVGAATRDRASVALIPLDGGAVIPLDAPMAVSGCRWIDLDGAGGDELYLMAGAGLVQITRAAGGAWRSRWLPVGSAVWDVIGGDLDGDGRRELVVSVGEWRAYEVRLVRAGDDGGLRVVDRVRLGVVAALADLGPDGAGGARIGALKLDVYPNVRDLPPDRPLGLEAGFYVLGLRGDRLQLGEHVALPELAGDRWHRTAATHFAGTAVVRATDLDGDGRRDVVARVTLDPHQPHLLVMLAGDGGGFATRVVSGFYLHGVVEGERDGVGELVVGVAEQPGLWILGGGGASVPRRNSGGASGVEPGPAPWRDPSNAAAWMRAEMLARIGQIEAAADALHRIATLTSSTAVKLRTLRRAAELLRAAGQRAAPMLEAIGQLTGAPPGARVDAWLAAIGDDLDHLAFLDGRARVERLLASGLPRTVDQAARLGTAQLRLPGASRAVVGLDGLDAAWEVADPSLVHVLPGGGLAVETLTEGVVASLPLRAGEHGIAVTIDAEVTRMEWASNLVFRLGPRDAAAGGSLSVEIGARGGGRLYRRGFTCQGTEPSGVERYDPLPDSDELIAVRLELTVRPGGGRGRCSIVVDGHAMAADLDVAPAAVTDWVLAIGAGQLADMTSATTRITSIAVAGATPVAASPTPLVGATHALVAHRPDQALAYLARLSSASAATWPATRLAVIAAAEAGDRSRAVALVEAAMARGGEGAPQPRQLAVLARARDGQFLPVLRAAYGRKVALLLAAMWSNTAHHDLDEPRVRSALLRDLDGLPAVTAETREATMSLLGYRGEALLAAGRLDDARRTLEAALALTPDGVADDRAERIAHLLAVEAAARDDEVTARRWALTAMERSHAPELAADQVLVDPALARLAGGPGWERVRELGRTLATAP